jgi:hypothetical protein
MAAILFYMTKKYVLPEPKAHKSSDIRSHIISESQNKMVTQAYFSRLNKNASFRITTIHLPRKDRSPAIMMHSSSVYVTFIFVFSASFIFPHEETILVHIGHALPASSGDENQHLRKDS